MSTCRVGFKKDPQIAAIKVSPCPWLEVGLGVDHPQDLGYAGPEWYKMLDFVFSHVQIMDQVKKPFSAVDIDYKEKR
jgi:hypothetical protein